MTQRFKTATALPLYVLNQGVNRLRAFRRDDDGAMTYPTIAFLLMMLGIGGIGVDFMRMERDRTHLQATLDRAVLAAADLDQTLDGKLVVQDYLNKAGLGEYYSPENVVVDDATLGRKSVSASVTSTFEAHLLKFSNGSDMPIYAASKAEESIDNLEISLVLDVSGSMRGSRLSNLKVAAKDFIETMVANTEDGKMSISIVPYATQVSVSDDLMAQFNTTGVNAFANCINFDGSDFNTTAMPLSATYERTMHFDPWYRYRKTPLGNYHINNEVCDTENYREVLVMEKDETKLKNFIQALQAWGNTSIDIGMKWGTALLDPSTQPAIANLTTGSDVPDVFSNRPFAHNDPDADTLKIVVLMTDGQNTSQYFIDSPYRSGASDIYYDTRRTDEWGYSYYNAYRSSSKKYYQRYTGRWEYDPRGGSNYAHRLTYPELFSYTSVRWVRDYLVNRSFVEAHGNSTKNARTKAICDAAKAQGITVYTIGFEAPSNGRAVLRDCASTDAHFYDVDGLEIKEAFKSIATSIRQLRLTQ
ncbi:MULTISPECIES: pilus assembly protein TadG-related protein [unclassified Pseudophaeobacter]|uniref:pilus assembly protein TadG-related protein n=1 Tax=unclassified Pseudophaeobacter TaxID=2637024 RepID=UPI000EFBED3D|nr:pilus assembly protein TadG-related protein [Pseudophaeobacter sp. EL27]